MIHKAAAPKLAHKSDLTTKIMGGTDLYMVAQHDEEGFMFHYSWYSSVWDNPKSKRVGLFMANFPLAKIGKNNRFDFRLIKNKTQVSS